MRRVSQEAVARITFRHFAAAFLLAGAVTGRMRSVSRSSRFFPSQSNGEMLHGVVAWSSAVLSCALLQLKNHGGGFVVGSVLSQVVRDK